MCAEINNMDLFGNPDNGENADMPTWKESPGNMDLIDYMVIVLARHFAGTVAFKGGYMLNKLMKKESRFTRAVDFSVMRAGDYEEVKTVLER